MSVDTGVLRGGLVGGQLSRNVAGAVDVVLGFDEIRYQSLIFNGAITAALDAVFPLGSENAGLEWTIENATSGNFAFGIKNIGGTALNIPAGRRITVQWTGTVFVVADPAIHNTRVQFTAAQILDLADTPVESVPAPGAGKYLHFLSAVLMLDHAGTGFAETADNLEIHYENEAGAAASAVVECT